MGEHSELEDQATRRLEPSPVGWWGQDDAR